MEPFIKLADVARLTGFSKFTLRRWIIRGIGPNFKRSPTGTFLFLASEVEKWAESLGQDKRESKSYSDTLGL